MLTQTLEEYIIRFAEVMDDESLTVAADGDRISRARAVMHINEARRAIFRELLAHGVAESRFSEKVALAADSSDTDMYPLPERKYRLIAIVDADDRVYHPVYDRHRNNEAGYLVEPRSIRWFNRDPPGATIYAILAKEPVLMTRGTAAAGAATTITLATTPTLGRTMEDADYYNGARIALVSGTGSGHERTITDYASRVATVATWTTQPDNTSIYEILDDLPRCCAHAVVLRAAVNIGRIDATFEHAVPRLYGEYEHAYRSALAELKTPSGTSADGPRRAERFIG